jgi:3-hydroxyacyl-CoA dehydrogenase
MTQPSIRRIAVVGAGTIGASWTAYFLAHGLDVTVSDPAPSAPDLVRRTIDTVWPSLVQLGLAPGASPDRVRFVTDPVAAVEGAEFVQENGPEKEDVKIALFALLDAALPLETIIASSSSGLLISRIQSGCAHPERCVIGHPFNPPHLMPLVEVVGGNQTSPDTIARTMAFYREIGKYPIHIRAEVTGHIANRLQAALWREAIHLVDTGVASVADVDAAVAYGPGLRWALMGPSLTFHLGGGEGGMEHFMAHLAGPMQTWWDALGSPALTPERQQKIIDGVAEATAGRGVPDLASERDALLVELLKLKLKR